MPTPSDDQAAGDERPGDEDLPVEVAESGHHQAPEEATVIGPSGERNPEPDDDEDGAATDHHLATAETLAHSPSRSGRDPAAETADEAPDRDRRSG